MNIQKFNAVKKKKAKKREIGQDWKLGNVLPLVDVIISHNPQCRCTLHKQLSCPQGKGSPSMQGWLTHISSMENDPAPVP